MKKVPSGSALIDSRSTRLRPPPPSQIDADLRPPPFFLPSIEAEDQVAFGKQYSVIGSEGTVQFQIDSAYGANIEVQRRELDYPIGQVQSTFGLSIIKWRGDLALGFNSLAQFSAGRNSKVAVWAGINNKMSDQITVKTSSLEHLSHALVAVIPSLISAYKKMWTGAGVVAFPFAHCLVNRLRISLHWIKISFSFKDSSDCHPNYVPDSPIATIEGNNPSAHVKAVYSLWFHPDLLHRSAAIDCIVLSSDIFLMSAVSRVCVVVDVSIDVVGKAYAAIFVPATSKIVALLLPDPQMREEGGISPLVLLLCLWFLDWATSLLATKYDFAS
ncbi:hypothetical protein L1887_36787 [Cichorium endivia]|nr:hypothetical protein L1887_36787 [Cichorium endivia]